MTFSEEADAECVPRRSLDQSGDDDDDDDRRRLFTSYDSNNDSGGAGGGGDLFAAAFAAAAAAAADSDDEPRSSDDEAHSSANAFFFRPGDFESGVADTSAASDGGFQLLFGGVDANQSAMSDDDTNTPFSLF